MSRLPSLLPVNRSGASAYMLGTYLLKLAHVVLLTWILFIASIPHAAPDPVYAQAPGNESPAGGVDNDQRFALIGDVRKSGRKPPAVFSRIVERIAQEDVGYVLSVGDLINADEGTSVDERWDALQDTLDDAMDGLESDDFFPCLGNHDVNDSRSSIESFQRQFDLPMNGPEGMKELVYSLDEGDVHLVCIATALPGSSGVLNEAQMAWLARDLSKTQAPYILVMGHAPAYPVGPHLGGSLDIYPAGRDRFWQLLHEHRVTAYLAGHEHLYNRREIGDITQMILGSSGSEVDGDYPGAFVGYAIFSVETDGLSVVVNDAEGTTRDRFTLAPRS
ncbi:MAG: metallophosphoesterase family protein [Chloroflexota bacterium]